jgi:broad specificity phosphatase PhoE
MTRSRASVPTVFFITHPDVAIDPAVAIPDWPLDGCGRERMRATAGSPWARNVRRVFASSERKARDGAEILATGLGLTGYGIVAALGEADRSATGYLQRQEFEETADAFFARPQQSVRGWESAAVAQARIVGAVERIVSLPPDDDDLAIVGHGGTGTLLYCHLRDCRSIGVMTNPRQTAGTGLPLTGRPENFFAMAGNPSIRRQVQTHEPVGPDQVSIVPSVTATASPPIAAPASSWSCTVTESVIRLGRAIS